jgi:alkanesulfonate monooxygenase SsuD/methylene tetrahydromethanopterin reductase-like flavin-dependent oxidoreductase (luciferase family)
LQHPHREPCHARRIRSVPAEPRPPDDGPEVCARELRPARLAEPLGFQSVWSTEHHCTGYLISPDVIRFLSHMAGCTEKVWLGPMVVALPWHDPIRVAEQAAMRDNLPCVWNYRQEGPNFGHQNPRIPRFS